MAPSRDACLLCSCPFFGKQQFFRCESCSKRVHAKCVTWPDEELQLLKSGSRSFCCNLCDLSHASGKPSEGNSAACSGEHCSSQTGSLSTCTPPGDDLAGLRRLLLDALEGISFLSDEVSQLREDNERLRKDHSRGVEQQARVVASLRAEVRFLREELTRRTAAVAVKAPVKPPAHVTVDPSVTSKQPAFSEQPLSKILSSSTSPPADVDTSERVSVMPVTASSAAVTEGERKKKPASFGVMKTSTISVAQRPQRPQRPKALFVTKLSPDTTAADIKKHIASLDLSPISCRRLQTKFQSYSSFYIEVDEETLQRLNDPSMWPLGCLFKPFRGELRDDMLHPSELVTGIQSAV